MIKTIIKRNGSTEDFAPSKLNKWGEWSAEKFGDLVDWSSAVLETVSSLPETVTSQFLQERLIKTFLSYDTWSSYMVAGRLYAALMHKQIHGDKIPTVKEVHTRLQNAGLMKPMDYSDDDYAFAESIINHSRDFEAPQFSLDYIREKYSLKNRLTNEEYETQQFVYMRMAMALAEEQPKERRRTDLYKFYTYLSLKMINAPTPNYVNLGTFLKGFASCCLYTTRDTAASIAAGNHIAEVMTYMSAGIGNTLQTRSIGDAVRGGLIKHQGKLPYYKAQGGVIKANLQNGRGGAGTTYYSAFDPEANTIARLKNPMSVEEKRNRDLDFGMIGNRFFARKGAKKEPVFTFNPYTAPDLWAAMFGKDEALFEELYTKYENDQSFSHNYIDARELLNLALGEASETGRHYLFQADEANRHTPFKDPIYGSNLCTEIAEPTLGYKDASYLYRSDDHGEGEIALCSLGGIVISNIPDIDTPEGEALYEDVMYYTLLMIDKCITMAEYAFPHLQLTATSRMNAGVGMMGYAHHLAKKHLKYSSQEAKEETHRVAERHMYYAIRASLRLGKEMGNAPWMHKTLWPEGWLPIDTYNRNVDKIVAPNYRYDWEALRQEIIANGGLRNSCLITYMPGESSSKGSGTCNSIYPIRDLSLVKTDNSITSYWAAPEGDILGEWYEFAWDVQTFDLIDHYALFQKFTDQSISADWYRRLVGDATVDTSEMLQEYFYFVRMGGKSRYYQNTLTTEGVELGGGPVACSSQGCTL